MLGREAELAILRAVFASGVDGVPRLAVVCGEAGIGKTRLVTEFLSEVVAGLDDRPVIAVGQCVDLGEIGAPFGPVRRMLRELYLAIGDAVFRDAAGVPLVVRALSVLLPDLAPDAEPAVDVAPEFLVEAIERLVTAVSSTHHLVLVFEDLHWADSATLGLLKSFITNLHGEHLTTLMTYRSDEMGPGHPLRPLLADLERSPAVRVLPLTRLSSTEAARVAQAVRVDLDDRGAARIAARSEGVPFLIEELVEFDVDAPLPDMLREVVLTRYDRVTPVAADVLATVAAGGVYVEEDLLAEVYDGDPPMLRAGLHEAIDNFALVADVDGYRFRHALIREAVYDELLPGERVELHARYATALQRRVSEGQREDAMELAYHWLQAHDISNAFDATLVARGYANDLLAPITSAQLGERLLDLWPRIPDAQTRAGLSRAVMALEVAQAYEDAGERELSLRVAEAGVGFTDPEETFVRASLLYEVGSRHRSAVRDSEACEAFLAARRHLDADGTPAECALVARIDAMRALTDPELFAAALEMTDHAVALAERSGDAGALMIALYARGQAFLHRGDLGSVVADARRAAALDADARTHLSAIVNLTGCLLTIGGYRECVEVSRRGVEEAVLAGHERGLGAFLLLNLAEAEIGLGDIESGLTHAGRALPALPTSPYFQNGVALLLAMATLWDGRVDESRAYRERERGGNITGIEESLALRLLLDGYAALTVTADALGPVADADDLATRTVTVLDWQQPALTERLLPMAAWLSAKVPEVRAAIFPSLERALEHPDTGPHSSAFKALARGFADGSGGAWREALAQAEAGRIPDRYIHLARFRLAESLLRDGKRDEAAALLAQVTTIAPARGASLIARWARDLAAAAGLAPPGTAMSQGPTTTPVGQVSLTRRELQVLGLVAQGLTNGQIGQRLYISPKTASLHVSAILAKIGAANRAEAAAWHVAEHSHDDRGTRTPAR